MNPFEKIELAARMMKEAIGNVLGLMTAVPLTVRSLRLNVDQIIAFCDAVPKGEELWVRFRTRRDRPDAPADYNFESFVVEILATTDHPVVR